MEFVHIPVMYDEVLEGLNIKADGTYVDGTLGGGGHSEGILNRLTTGRLIANDLDLEAIEASKKRFGEKVNKVTFIHNDYKQIVENLNNIGIEQVDGILLDLGVSSYQIDNPERGFSYMKDAELDMRLDRDGNHLTAEIVVNTYSEEDLTRIFIEYGEETFAKKIAAAIVKARKIAPIKTTGELAEIIINNYPIGFKKGHPAKKVFQALRIEVNGELIGLYEAITKMTRALKKGGRICIITFHSLEDRIVKNCFRDLEIDCICDKSLPICVCNKVSEITIITKKPIVPSDKELENNKRAESAKLRIAEKK